VAVGSERQWARFCSALGAPRLTDDPRFATNGVRVSNRESLRPQIAAILGAATSASWLARLAAHDVPAGPINDLAAAFAAPQVAALGSLVELEHPVLGPVRQVAPPFMLGATPATVRTPPPLLGEHSDEILGELGCGPAEIERLRAAGTI
jgi:crotonobetainyl-CoA:carnitine CoA-transferase CaiB-like acyl-CoA transferase